jgi:hypothetical protein
MSQNRPDAPLFYLSQDHISRNTKQNEQSPVKAFSNQNQINKAIHRLSYILSNTVQMCPRNTYESARRARKTQAFLFSRTRPISTCNNPYTIEITTKSRTGQDEHEAGGACS